jgi:hypothetical protein
MSWVEVQVRPDHAEQGYTRIYSSTQYIQRAPCQVCPGFVLGLGNLPSEGQDPWRHVFKSEARCDLCGTVHRLEQAAGGDRMYITWEMAE